VRGGLWRGKEAEERIGEEIGGADRSGEEREEEGRGAKEIEWRRGEGRGEGREEEGRRRER